MNLPDTRGWIVIGLFALTAYILTLIAWRPDLAGNTMFVTLATLIVGSGGLLASIGFYFGSSASSSKKDDAIATMATTAAAKEPGRPQA